MNTLSQQRYPDEPIDVLIVEDNPGDIRLLEEAFEESDGEIRVRSVTDGDEAVDFLTQQGEYELVSLPDIVLLDLDLPGRDGIEILKVIRKDSQLQRLPVIVLSGSRESENVARCYEAQTNAYLTKPTDNGEFSALAEAIEGFWFKHANLPPV